MRPLSVVPLLLALASPAWAQESELTLAGALARARERSPEAAVSRAESRAASAAARQAGALGNPSLTLGRERTSGPSGHNAQTVIQLEQRLDFTGVRSADATAARARMAGSEALAVQAGHRLDARVVRVFAHLVGARRRVSLADRLEALTDSASTIVRRRFEAGDASGFDRRRLELEAARYAALAVAARFERDSVATELAALVGIDDPAGVRPVDALPRPAAVPPVDTLLSWAERRPDLLASRHAVVAAEADVAGRSREWIPAPVVSAGYKTEEAAGQRGSATGFVVGLSVPVPLWDRRGAARGNRLAIADRARADAERARRDAGVEVRRLAGGMGSLLEQRQLLGARLGSEADLALHAVAVAFAEGELPLAQWLDAVRAYHEARVALVQLDVEIAARWADLAAAVGGAVETLAGVER